MHSGSWSSRAAPSALKLPRGIASHLVISLDTVKKHVSHLMGKLGAANRTEAVARSRELGLID
jgi:DNA-binding NarL/FixJ family response regulator